MLAILTVILAAVVPDVTAGPALAEEAQTIGAPIQEVTVYSDRARLRRRTTVNLKAGIHPLRLPDLPGSVMLNTVRVECRAARVLRVETVPVDRERFSIEQVEEHIIRLEALTDKLAALEVPIRKVQVLLPVETGHIVFSASDVVADDIADRMVHGGHTVSWQSSGA